MFVSIVMSVTIVGAARPAPAAAAQPSDVPANAIERVDLRTASSRTFQLADGGMLTQLFDKPIFYQPDASSSWQPIDTRLSATADRTSALSANSAPSRIAFDAAGSALGFLRLRGKGHAINIGLPTALRAARTASLPQSQEGGSYAEYANFLPGGVDLRVFPETDGYSMFLVLSSRPAANTFSFTIDAPGLVLGADSMGTPDALAFTDTSGNVVGEMPRPFMQDSSYVEGRGGGLYSQAVSMSYTGGNGHWLLTLSIDPMFLDGATYPVYVDPSVTSFPNQDATAQDTFASSKYPGSNFNTYRRPDSPYYHETWLGNEPGTSYYNQVFMRFQDIDSVLGDVDIDSAYLEFYPYWQYWHSDPRQSWMKRITGTWQQNQLTWNNRPTVEANTYMSFYTTQGSFSHVDVTQYVQDVVDGTWVNNGFQINVDSQGQGGWKRIVSLDDTDSSLRPHLDVTWHAAYTPVVTSVWPDGEWMDDSAFEWTYDDGDGNPSTTGTQAAFQVQVNTSSTYGSGSMVTDSGAISSSDWTWALPGTVSLIDGQDYYWRVRVSDGSTWSDWYQTSLHWDTTQFGTGVDATDDTVTSPSDVDLTQAEIDQANTEFEAYLLDPVNIGVEYPDWCATGPDDPPCPGAGSTPPPIPSEKHLTHDGVPFEIFHQRAGNWCVIATVESVLNWLDPGDSWESPSSSQHTIRYDNLIDPHFTESGPHQGVGTKYGLNYVNHNRPADAKKYVPVTLTHTGDLGRFESYIKAAVYNKGRPLFARVQLKPFADPNTNKPVQTFPWRTHHASGHATLAVGYSDSGTRVDIADPYPNSSCSTNPTSGPFDGSPTDGCVWAGYSTANYLKSLDTGSGQLWF